MKKKNRKRKLRTFTLPNKSYEPFQNVCEREGRNMSREIEAFMKEFVRKVKR